MDGQSSMNAEELFVNFSTGLDTEQVKKYDRWRTDLKQPSVHS